MRKISPDGTITTIAGGGITIGDGGPATQAFLCYPSAIEIDPQGNLYIAEHPGHRIRKVDTSGIIATVAGVDECEGLGGFSGDGGPATSARLNYPFGLDVDSSGSLYFADMFNHRVRVIAPDGIISTAVGGAEPCVDVVCLGLESLSYPSAARIGPDGALYITERCRVKRASNPQPSPARRVTTVAGLVCGSGGDGGPALLSWIDHANAIAFDPAGNLYFADTSNSRVRRVEGPFL